MSNIASAKVELTIEQLDAMRQETSELKERNKFLEDHQKMVKLDFKVTELGYGIDYNHGSATRDYYGRFIPETHFMKETQNIKTEKVVYVGLDEVMQDLELNAQSKVSQKIKVLQDELNAALNRNENLSDKFSKEKMSLGDVYDKKIEKLKEKHESKLDVLRQAIELLTNEIKVLKGQEIDKSKDDQIKELKQTIERLSWQVKNPVKKGFWSIWG